jgi:hypothetical protein
VSGDNIAATLDAGTKLLGVIIWPAILFYFFIRFSHQLQTLLENVSELSLTGAGL